MSHKLPRRHVTHSHGMSREGLAREGENASVTRKWLGTAIVTATADNCFSRMHLINCSWVGRGLDLSTRPRSFARVWIVPSCGTSTSSFGQFFSSERCCSADNTIDTGTMRPRAHLRMGDVCLCFCTQCVAVQHEVAGFYSACRSSRAQNARIDRSEAHRSPHERGLLG